MTLLDILRRRQLWSILERRLSLTSKFNLAVGKQAEHQRATACYGWSMRGARSINAPTASLAIEFRGGRHRHDEAYLAIGMAMGRTDDLG
jgi:hypothetical protein